MKINIEELELIFNILISRLQEFNLSEINIEDIDYYWSISYDEWTNMNKVPENTVGSLSDDWNELNKIIIGEKEIMTLVDFDRFSSIIKAISNVLYK